MIIFKWNRKLNLEKSDLAPLKKCIFSKHEVKRANSFDQEPYLLEYQNFSPLKKYFFFSKLKQKRSNSFSKVPYLSELESFVKEKANGFWSQNNDESLMYKLMKGDGESILDAFNLKLSSLLKCSSWYWCF